MFGLKPLTKRSTALLPRTEGLFGWVPEFETLMNRVLGGWPVLETSEWPYEYALTMEEKEKEVVVRAELPGFEPSELKVELVGERLTIEAEHKEEKEKKEEKAETYAHVKRVVTLPVGIEADKAEATYRNGVLEVHVPRKPEAMGRKIEVKV